MSRIAVLVLALLTLPARANPVLDSIKRFQQVPGTTHVQITRGDLKGMEGWMTTDPPGTPPRYVRRDQRPVDARWVGPIPYMASTGSGPGTFLVYQTCDCHVPPGKHAYYVGDSSRRDLGASLLSSLTLSDEALEPTELEVLYSREVEITDGPIDPTSNEWHASESPEIQGLDCRAMCTTPPRPALR